MQVLHRNVLLLTKGWINEAKNKMTIREIRKMVDI